MALTLDGMVPMPIMGGTGGSTGLAAGAGAIGGLILGSLINGNNGGLFGGNNNNGAPVVAAAATDVLLNPAFQSLQNQVEGVSAQLTSNGILNSVADMERTLGNSTANLSNQLANLSTAQATQNFTTLSSINDLGRDVQTQSNQNALQQLNSFNNLTTTTLQGFNSSAMQIQNSTNQIIAQGTASAAAVAAGFCQVGRQMAECCCEIKGTISAEGNATRALINDLNVQNLRDQLAAANNKVSNNEQNQYLLSTILHHVTPTAGTVIV